MHSNKDIRNDLNLCEVRRYDIIRSTELTEKKEEVNKIYKSTRSATSTNTTHGIQLSFKNLA